MKSYQRHATPSHSSSIHSSSRDHHFIQPPSLIDRSCNYINPKTRSSDDGNDADADDDPFDDYGLPRPSTSKKFPLLHNRRFPPSWQRLLTLPVLLTLTWFVVLYWGERHVFSSSIEACDWTQWERWPADASPHHLVLVADPQLVDPHTYPGRPWPLSTFTVRHTDLFLRRSFSEIQKGLHPDTVFFLGDLFDGGREWSTGDSKSPESRWRKYGDGYWMGEYERWGRIFVDRWNDGGIRAGKGQRGRKLIAGLPGNHDLGFARGIQIPVRKRFNAFFGEGNRVDVVGNHTFVSVDTVSLSAMDQQGGGGGGEEELWRPTKEFLDEIQSIKKRAISNELTTQNPKGYPRFKYPHRRLTGPDDVKNIQTQRRIQQDQLPFPSIPTILLSHVPLYRDKGTPCGPLREHQHPASILIQSGYQYQNVLTPQITQLLIDKLTNSSSKDPPPTHPPTPLHIFSGDDHDYCSVTHTSYSAQPVEEITVKSLSWAMGIRKPGFVMVSLWNPLPSSTTQTQPRPHNQDNTHTNPHIAAAADQKQQTSSSSSTIQTHLCLLPDQLSIFLRVYGILFLVTLITILFRSWWWFGDRKKMSVYQHPRRPRSLQYSRKGGTGMVEVTKTILKDTGWTCAYMALVIMGWYVYLSIS